MTEPSITCPQCGLTSYHPRDIAERYCGHCHQWHGEMAHPGSIAFHAGQPLSANPFDIDAQAISHAAWYLAWRRAERAMPAEPAARRCALCGKTDGNVSFAPFSPGAPARDYFHPDCFRQFKSDAF